MRSYNCDSTRPCIYIVVKLKIYDVGETVVLWLQPSGWGLRTRLPRRPSPTVQFQSQVFLELEGPVTAIMYVKILGLTEIKGKTKEEKNHCIKKMEFEWLHFYSFFFHIVITTSFQYKALSHLSYQLLGAKSLGRLYKWAESRGSSFIPARLGKGKLHIQLQKWWQIQWHFSKYDNVDSLGV